MKSPETGVDEEWLERCEILRDREHDLVANIVDVHHRDDIESLVIDSMVDRAIQSIRDGKPDSVLAKFLDDLIHDLAEDEDILKRYDDEY